MRRAGQQLIHHRLHGDLNVLTVLFVFRELERNVDGRPSVYERPHHEQAHHRGALRNLLQVLPPASPTIWVPFSYPYLKPYPAGGPPNRGHAEEEKSAVPEYCPQ